MNVIGLVSAILALISVVFAGLAVLLHFLSLSRDDPNSANRFKKIVIAAGSIAALFLVALLIWLIVWLVYGKDLLYFLHYKQSAHLYGVSRPELRKSIEIDRWGHALTEYSFSVAAYGEQVTKLQQRLYGSRLQVWVGNPAYDQRVEQSAEWKSNGRTSKPPTIEMKETKGGTITAQDFILDPTLDPGQEIRMEKPFVYHSCSEFYMSEEAMKDAREEVDSAWIRLRYPTELLEIQVTFPVGFKPTELQPAVWVGTGYDNLSMTESQRRQPFETDIAGQRYLLRVRYPVTGATYGLKWVPPVNWNPEQANPSKSEEFCGKPSPIIEEGSPVEASQ